MSIREISRRTGLSRNTVEKYLRAGEEAPRYAKRASSSKLDPYADKLATWPAIEATKSRKQRRNLRQIHTLNLKRRTSSTYPHREAFRLKAGESVFDGNLGSEIGGIQHRLAF
jgi:transposase